MSDITVFIAAAVRTMDESQPTGDAVAVRDGRIVEVGTLESLRPWLERHDHAIDDRFADRVLLPGFIDPHVHPTMMALLMATDWLTPEAWELPGRSIPETAGRRQYLERVTELHTARADPEQPLVVFGYHAQYHGEIVRADLDAISSDRPIVLWQRSFHELRCNSRALEWLDAAEGAAWDPHIDLESGRMFESGMVWGLKVLSPDLLGRGRLERNLRDFRSLVQAGGVTTIADAGYGLFDVDFELAVLFEQFDRPDTPFTLHLMPNIGRIRQTHPNEDVFEKLAEFSRRGTERIRFLDSAKFLADGAFIAQLMQIGPPGYIDGHNGAWLTEPERLIAQIRPFWERGWDINIHTNGDVGVDACLDAISTLLHEQPRFDHRTTLHHFGISTQAQSRRLAALDVAVQANGYYLYLFGDLFIDEWLGYERASQMTRVGSARRNGASVAVHSDIPMGPIAPLLAASAMATRTTRGGHVLAPAERLSPIDALRSITIEPAYQLRLDHEVGSLAAGKRADMVALSDDPLTLDPADWPSITIAATVLGGIVFPLDA